MENGNMNEKEFDGVIQTKLNAVDAGRLMTFSHAWLKARDIMTHGLLTLSPGGNLSQAAKIMTEKHASCIVIIDDGKMKGIFTETDFLRRSMMKEEPLNKITLGSVMSQPVKTIDAELTIVEVCMFMEVNHLKRAPVSSNGEIIGIITQTDILKVLTLYGMWKDVDEIMSKDVVVTQAKAVVTEAAWIMTSRAVSCVVVLEGEKVVGVFTKRDLVKKVISAGKDSDQVKVEDVMTYPVINVPPTCSVLSASKIMEKKKIRRLIIMKGETVCGIVAQLDIIKTIRAKLQQEEAETYDILEKSENGVYTLDGDFKIIYINPAFMKLLGIANRRELLGKSFLPIQFWANIKESEKIMNKLRKKEDINHEEIAFKAADGKIKHVKILASLNWDISGNVNGSHGTVFDVSEKKEIVELIKIKENLLTAQERLKEKIEELERFNKLAVDRELKMVELKSRIKELEEKLAENGR